jgi:hypothetical protein
MKPTMATPPAPNSQAPPDPLDDVPERICTWCKIPMRKRLVGGGAFVHYLCPKCIFQHTTKRVKG